MPPTPQAVLFVFFRTLGSPPDRELRLPQLATGRGAWPSEGPANRRPPEPGPLRGLAYRPRRESRPDRPPEVTRPGSAGDGRPSTGAGSPPHSVVFPPGYGSIFTCYCLLEVEKKEKKFYLVISSRSYFLLVVTEG